MKVCNSLTLFFSATSFLLTPHWRKKSLSKQFGLLSQQLLITSNHNNIIINNENNCYLLHAMILSCFAVEK